MPSLIPKKTITSLFSANSWSIISPKFVLFKNLYTVLYSKRCSFYSNLFLGNFLSNIIIHNNSDSASERNVKSLIQINQNLMRFDHPCKSMSVILLQLTACCPQQFYRQKTSPLIFGNLYLVEVPGRVLAVIITNSFSSWDLNKPWEVPEKTLLLICYRSGFVRAQLQWNHTSISPISRSAEEELGKLVQFECYIAEVWLYAFSGLAILSAACLRRSLH